MKTTNNKSGKSVYKIITERVVAGLEKEGTKWFRPWTNDNGAKGYAINHATKQYYKGINSLMLTGAIHEYGYKSLEFLTAKQIKEAGGTLNEGAIDHLVVYWLVSYTYKNKWYKNEKALTQATGKTRRDTGVYSHAAPRYYKVYNLTDTKGVVSLTDAEIKKALEGTIFDCNTDAESIYSNMPKRPTLRHGGNKAFYRPSAHHVQMPNKKQFKTKGVEGDYYKTLFHELVHSTGNEDLLNRPSLTGFTNFGDEEYSKEELVAEMGSMFLVGLLDIETTDGDKNSQAYIKSFIKNLKKDENEKDVLFASIQARKAVEYILQK